MRVPLPTNTISGSSFAAAVATLTPIIKKACGGDLCLTVVKQDDGPPDPDPDAPCDIVGNAAKAADDNSVTLARGADLVLLVNIPCEDRPKPPKPPDENPPAVILPASSKSNPPSTSKGNPPSKSKSNSPSPQVAPPSSSKGNPPSSDENPPSL